MELLLLAVALAMDSVALSMANGARHAKITLWQTCKMAGFYGLAQAVMPVLGYLLGLTFARFIAQIDHFIAFMILCFLGLKMIKDSRDRPENVDFSLGFGTLLAGALATSIDALAVGVTFSFGAVNIALAACVIGAVCFALCVPATYVGRKVGEKFESKAMILGGVILIMLGCKILAEHLFF